MLRKFLAALLIATVTFSGCQYLNPLAPIGWIVQLGVYWYEGDAHKYYHNDQATMEKAVRGALKELKIPLKEKVSIAPDPHPTIQIMAGDTKKFNIRIKYVNDGVSLVSIRVNTFGDHPLAELIYKYIDKQPGVQNFVTLEELKKCVQPE